MNDAPRRNEELGEDRLAPSTREAEDQPAEPTPASMYVGCTNAERGEQLRNLELLLAGYAIALQHHGIRERVADYPREFGDFLASRFGWSVAAGPIAAIRDAARNDDDAWERFWVLTKEFQQGLEK